MKQTVYVETSIISYLTARPSRDVRVIAWQDYTATWWRIAPEKYELYVSELVRQEAVNQENLYGERICVSRNLYAL